MEEKTETSTGRPGREKLSTAVAVLSAAGFIICVYLTIAHYSSSGESLCKAGSGCAEVLTSEFSTLLGIPLSFFGAVVYAALVALSLIWGVRRKQNLTVGIASAALGVSIYLSWAEMFVIKEICPFCAASAFITSAIWILSVIRGPASSAVAGVVISASVAFGAYSVETLEQSSGRHAKREMQRLSAGFAEKLALHLSENGAVMYGSFKCPSCIVQKKRFGKYAKNLNYVECHRDGEGANPALCSEKRITAYPTWEINGSFHRGAMTLEQLSKVSGYGKPSE